MASKGCPACHMCECQAFEMQKLRKRVKISGEVEDLERTKLELQEYIKLVRLRLQRAEDALGCEF